MNTNKKIKLIGTLIGVILFIALIAGVSYAWFTWRSSNINISGITECFDINYTNGQTINNENVILFDENAIINDGKVTIKNGMALTDATAYIDSSCNIFANLTLQLNVTSLNSTYISGNSVGAFKYIIASYDPNTYTDITTTALNGQSFDIIVKGSITNTGTITLLDDALSHNEKGYLLIFYVDGSLAMNDAQDSTFSATITGVATQTEPTIVQYITNLYTSGNPTLITQEVSNDRYYYSYQDTTQTWGLMNDGQKEADTIGSGSTTITDTTSLTTGTEGNIRYFGPSDSVNNYIYFNCSDYSNQSSDTCELWRIIGIVDGKVKIIRNDNIGNLAWDQDKNQDSSLTTYSNNWETSSLQLFLNGLYYDRGTTTTHTYYSGEDGTTTTSLDLATIGITEATRNNNLISESTWYLGNYSGIIYPNEIYSYERTNKIGTTIYSGNPYTINANIGLMSGSDYGYGTNLTKCSNVLNEYAGAFADSYACRSNNWFYTTLSNWLLNPNYNNGFYSSLFNSGGGTFATNAYDANGVRPTLYLDTNLLLDDIGNGSSDNPYQLLVS